MKLFMVHFGYYLPATIYEQHGCAFVVAADAHAARTIFRLAPGVTNKCHVDGVEEVRVKGFAITVQPADTDGLPAPERLGWGA